MGLGIPSRESTMPTYSAAVHSLSSVWANIEADAIHANRIAIRKAFMPPLIDLSATTEKYSSGYCQPFEREGKNGRFGRVSETATGRT